MAPLPQRVYAAAKRLYGIDDYVVPNILTEYLEPDHQRDGFYVKGWFFVPASELEPEPGLAFAVWIAEQDDHTQQWVWRWEEDYFHNDIDGKDAKASAHERARYLRRTYPCAYVAVLPAGKQPLPIHNPDAFAGEGEMRDFSSSWLGQ
jgi:hypothetical protein